MLHDAFVAQGCRARSRPQPAVTLGAGAMWIERLRTPSTKAGRYVQGGGCTTVGVAGLIQSGGFGSFSKALRHGGGEPARGRGRDRRRRGAHRQCLHQSRTCSGP